jgi:alpha-L-arabinofuranosidase
MARRAYHVSVDGLDTNDGSGARPLRTISAASKLAMPGDTVVVHAGVYRERIAPPRGGTSNVDRITYRAADGEAVVIKGSEPVKGWEKVDNDAWKVVIPNGLFGDCNPYSDLIAGDWFDDRGREHHTGAVYLDNHWLTEAVTHDDVLSPVGDAAMSYVPGGKKYLLGVSQITFRNVSGNSRSMQAADLPERSGVLVWKNPENGESIAVVRDGDWIRYDSAEHGGDINEIEFSAATRRGGGTVEVRDGDAKGELLYNEPRNSDSSTA